MSSAAGINSPAASSAAEGNSQAVSMKWEVDTSRHMVLRPRIGQRLRMALEIRRMRHLRIGPMTTLAATRAIQAAKTIEVVARTAAAAIMERLRTGGRKTARSAINLDTRMPLT